MKYQRVLYTRTLTPELKSKLRIISNDKRRSLKGGPYEKNAFVCLCQGKKTYKPIFIRFDQRKSTMGNPNLLSELKNFEI